MEARVTSVIHESGLRRQLDIEESAGHEENTRKYTGNMDDETFVDFTFLVF